MSVVDHLSTEDQARLASALERLLGEGLLWRGDERDLRAYNTLARWGDLAAAQLAAQGWELRHHDPAQAYYLVQRKGRHKIALKREAALCLLVLRLLYAETPAALTPYPVVTVAELRRRCEAFAFEPELAETLPELAGLKLIRAPGGRPLRLTDPDQLIELLPALELAVPDSAISDLAQSR
jgi:hypothetical protein